LNYFTVNSSFFQYFAAQTIISFGEFFKFTTGAPARKMLSLSYKFPKFYASAANIYVVPYECP